MLSCDYGQRGMSRGLHSTAQPPTVVCLCRGQESGGAALGRVAGDRAEGTIGSEDASGLQERR